MRVFISGGAKCGKSSLAQELTLALAGDGRRYYVATLIPTGAEDDARIRAHLADREGMGFETLECFRGILQCLDHGDRNGAFLVDSVTSLLQNALFPPEKDYAMDLEGAEGCIRELEAFAQTVKDAVFVSDYIYSDAARYSESTEAYRKFLARADRKLAEICDTVIEVTAGQAILHKGVLPL